MIRVLIADDFPLIREALVRALEKEPGLTVVGVAADGDEALALARELQPDVLVLDVRMPAMSGITALTHLTAELPDVRVLILSAKEDREVVIEAITHGAAGYIVKRSCGAELVAAVRAVHRGEAVVAPSLVSHLMAGLHPEAPRDSGTACLTEAERAVLRQVALGRTDAEISRDLFVSPRTVQGHLARIRTKLDVRRRTELTRWALDHQVT